MPGYLIDDPVVVKDVLKLANKFRLRTGLDEVRDLIPGLTSSPTSCPIAKTLDHDCRVGPSAVTFPDFEVATVFAELAGQYPNARYPRYTVPTPMIFRTFIRRFDAGHFRQYSSVVYTRRSYG